MTAEKHVSCLYTGTVMHRRFKPRAHRLSYRVFWAFVDLDELPRLSARLRLFSLERFNLFGFRNSDHGDGSSRPLRQQVEAHLAAAGIELDGGPILLLCMPRLLGFVLPSAFVTTPIILLAGFARLRTSSVWPA